ncbi:XRE family transcriptional regulator [Dokdonia sinensis]|uniref:XRE family transcriptional regulator n=2 Tax=Dokdonia sinensis TaxID=2479847 RepID=A0A3M0GC51_9FLAO|nr:XRE family transcriptional regulator [Dokdonia sinensis]
MKQPQLGQKILELRQLKGLTQEELVEQCNISVRTIQRIEAGETMPRVYTIKTILSALDRDLDDLQQDSIFETKVKEAMLLEIDESKDVSFILKNLHIGWITGILSMIAFIFQFIEDSYFIAQGDYYFGGLFYIILGVVSIILFALHMRAFILIGELFKSYLLKVTSILFISINTLLILYVIIDLNFDYMPQGAYAIIFCVFYGLAYGFFGYALLKLRNLGQLPKAAGIIQMIIGGMFLTVLFSIVAAPASILIQGLNVAIILKVYEVVKKQLS